ncbi:MAG: cytochrome c [Cellvibrio sp.]
MRTITKKYLHLGFILTVFVLSACSEKNPEQISAPAVEPIKNVFKPTTGIQDLMIQVIDPNIDAIWNSVSVVSTYEGVVETKPQTEEEWQKLRGHALTLREVYNLLVIPGRHVAEKDAITSSGEGELHAPQIESLINSKWDEFVSHAAQLQTASDQVLRAIDARNVEALEEAGGVVEHACEACHSAFWYPGDKPPQ